MSAPYHNAEERVEDAVKAYLAANLAVATKALPIEVGFNFDEADPPFLSVACPRSQEYPPDTGNLEVSCVVSVASTASTTRATHAAHVANTLDLLFDAGALGYLNALTGVGLVFQLQTKGTCERKVVDKALRITSQEITYLVSMS